MLKNIPRVLVTPNMLSSLSVPFEPLERRGIEVVHNTGTYPMNASQLANWIGDEHVAIIGLDELTDEVFDACTNLQLVARNGVGMDTVDLEAATRHGVIVTAPLGANSTSVAELIMGLVTSLLRHILPNHNQVQQGIWQRTQGMELAGKTLGIIGLGRVGKKVARRAQAFNMRVIANDIVPEMYYAHEQQIPMLSFEEVLEQSDVLSLHIPLTAQTHHMLNRTNFAKMKKSSYLINTARGAIIDTQALISSLDSGHLAGAALDVHPIEGVVELELQKRPNVITTTHLGAYTGELLFFTTEMAVQSILDILDGNPCPNIMNPTV